MTRITPVVASLILVNVVVYLWEQASGTIVFARFGVGPGLCNRAECDYAMLPVAVHHGQWYRLLTAAFLHANFEHILFNMITLAIIGPAVEAEFGKVRFIALYLVAAFGGSVASYLLSPADQLGLGASGAIFGLMGAYFVLARRRRWEVTTILGLIVLNLVISFADSVIDWRAHLGGLVTGIIVGYGLDRASQMRRAGAARIAGVGADVLVAVAVVVAVAVPLALLTLLPPGQVNL